MEGAKMKKVSTLEGAMNCGFEREKMVGKKG